MQFREAITVDIPGIMVVRMAVQENRIPVGYVTEADVADFIHRRGKGWVCTVDDVVVGFSIVDLVEHNIWALFVSPDWAEKGIGRKLQNLMLDWYFSQTKEKVWLGTGPGTRAEVFYAKTGWTKAGVVNNDEVKFEMTYEDWNRLKGIAR
jgi:GNAT superfamily N-acetyltransferase